MRFGVGTPRRRPHTLSHERSVPLPQCHFFTRETIARWHGRAYQQLFVAQTGIIAPLRSSGRRPLHFQLTINHTSCILPSAPHRSQRTTRLLRGYQHALDYILPSAVMGRQPIVHHINAVVDAIQVGPSPFIPVIADSVRLCERCSLHPNAAAVVVSARQRPPCFCYPPADIMLCIA